MRLVSRYREAGEWTSLCWCALTCRSQPPSRFRAEDFGGSALGYATTVQGAFVHARVLAWRLAPGRTPPQRRVS